MIQTIRTGFRKHGPRLVRSLIWVSRAFDSRSAEDLALDVIGEAIKRVPAKKYIAHCEAAIKSSKDRGTAGKTANAAEPKAAAAKASRSKKSAK